MIVNKKTKVTAAEEMIEEQVAEVSPAQENPVQEPVVENTPCIDPKACAISHIMEAIKSLTKISKTDPIAKDSIANLAVVMFDLQ